MRPLPTLLALTLAAAFGGFAATALRDGVRTPADAATPALLPATAALPASVNGTPLRKRRNRYITSGPLHASHASGEPTASST